MRGCDLQQKGMGMQPAGRSGNVNEETSAELTQCGIQLKDGIIGYSKTYTIKPAMRLSDGKRVAVKLYNDTTLASMYPEAVQAQGGPRPKTQRQKDFAAQYIEKTAGTVSAISAECRVITEREAHRLFASLSRDRAFRRCTAVLLSAIRP